MMGDPSLEAARFPDDDPARDWDLAAGSGTRVESAPGWREVPTIDYSLCLNPLEAASEPLNPLPPDPRTTGGGAEERLTFPSRGDIVAGFRIISELGRGAFARVYLAEQVELAGRPVALKVSKALGEEPRTLARLQHTHIVPIHSVHDDPATGLRLLCMPYVGGANLAQVLDRAGARLPSHVTGQSLVEALDQIGGRAPDWDAPRPAGSAPSRSLRHAATRGVGSPSHVRSLFGRYWARLPWWRSLAGTNDICDDEDLTQPARRYLRQHSYVQAAVWIAARLAEGLDHAHQRGVLHRDLKPSNILIAADGTPMILDFNLSAVPRDGGEEAALGGTLPYMAPEHLDAFDPEGMTPPEAVDERSDIYALGLILFEMVAGYHPFSDPPAGLRPQEVLKVMAAERRRGAPSARAANPQVSWGLDSILRQCLDPDPDRRYARAGDLAEDLRRLLDDLPLKHAPEPSLRERAAKWLRRHPECRSAGTVGGLAAALILGFGVLAYSIADRLEVASARVRRSVFRGAFHKCQLLLNTTSGPIESHLPRGIALANQMLEAYGVGRADDWTAGPLVRRLSAAERADLLEEMSELVLLRARARIVLADRSGDEGRRRRALREGIAWLDRVERFDPHPSAALFEERARYHAALGQAAEAHRDRARAATIPPTTSRDFYLLGTAQLAAGQADRAERSLSRAVALDPRRFWAWFVLGLCHADQGRYAEAAADYGVCAVLFPDFEWPHTNRGLALAAAGRFPEARATYDRALEINPNSAEARVNRALTCLELGDPAQALRDLDCALALGRRSPAIRAARAEALARLGRRDDAERDFAEALRARPDDPTLLVARGFFRLASDPAGAEADFARVLRLDPHHARAHLGYAYLLFPRDRRAALDHAERALQTDPRLTDARQVRALLLAHLGDPAAVAEVDRLVLTPTPHNLYNAACALAILAQQIHDNRFLPRALDLL
ncbi:MAG: tetratricopeptide repeat protein, partial [Isosphaeraceae bacterium]|nr:tetratricopeptide repeat protein [Isosphaeraceae bacterium]